MKTWSNYFLTGTQTARLQDCVSNLTKLGYTQVECNQALLERFRVRADEPSAFQS
jgi:hypothetical protein